MVCAFRSRGGRRLVQMRPRGFLEDKKPVADVATITVKGLDFLQDDGGLGAILNVVTVRFEAETLRALIEAKVDASDEPPEQKSAMVTCSRMSTDGAICSQWPGRGLSSFTA